MHQSTLRTFLSWALIGVLGMVMSLLAGCGGGGGGSSGGCGFLGCSSGTGTGSSSSSPTVTVTIVDSAGGAVAQLPTSGSVTVKASVNTASGAAVPNAVVTFSTDAAYATLIPASGTALTDASGVAAVTMSAASLTTGGASTVTASTVVGSSTASGFAAYGVGAANVTLSSMSINAVSIPAYGTSTVAVTVNVNGAPSTAPITVSFSSGCAASGKATIAPSVLTINGVATATYTDKGCNGTDTITATALDKTVQGAITSAGPAPANIQFISASPSSIALKGTAGLKDISNVTFMVVDASGNPVPATTVEFDLTNWTGGIKLDDNTQTQVNAMVGSKVRKQTAADGTVTVSVQSGTNPVSIWVLANLLNNTSLQTQSSKLVISTGLPSQDRFSLSVGTHNIEGWSYDGVTTNLTIYAFDRVGNPIPDGSTINFVTEGAGTSPGTCSALSGTCSVQFVSGENRPFNESLAVCRDASSNIVPGTSVSAIANTCVTAGRVSVLAYANGEEGFDDTNGNNFYDSGEAFRDIGDVFVDNNENGTWDSPEQYFPFAAAVGNLSTRAACPSYTGYGNVKSKLNTCNGTWGQAQVRRDQVVILSGSSVAHVYAPDTPSNTTVSSGGAVIVTDDFGGTPAVTCSATTVFRISDSNNNPLPAGTTVAVTSNGVMYSQTGATDPVAVATTVGGDVVLDTIMPGGTFHGILMQGSKCASKPTGTLTVTVTSPKGLKSSVSVKVN